MKIDWYNVARTLVQMIIVMVGLALPLLTADFWHEVGVDADPIAALFATVAIGLAAWWRQKYQDAFERK